MGLIERTRVLLGRRWAGLFLTGVVFALGWASQLFHPLLVYVPVALGVLMTLGVVLAFVRDQRLPPPSGEVHSVDGIRVHILAEGENHGNHTVIWVPGGHGAGLIMYHLHKVMRTETRSILFDRTGSGWTGPARRTVTLSGEVRQLQNLLEQAGEKGPFVLAGHSFGGMFSANFAHHFPEQVAGIVLLDSTSPWNVAYVGKLSFSDVLRKAWWGALAWHFCLQRFIEPEIDDSESALAKELADVAATVNGHSLQAKSLLAEASVFQAVMDNPLDMVIGKGALGDIPLLLLSANPSVEELAAMRSQIRDAMDLTETQTDNLMHGLRDSNDQQVALSSRGRHVLMPEGATHMYPYEYPEIVLDEVRKMIAVHH
jgi:pimeloyl-ACP methyl ester carboxylesterase